MSSSLRIPWDESILTGVKLVDVQHKFLFDVINDLADAIERGKGGASLGQILNLLKHYAEWHFEREELCMERHRCPAASANQRAHAQFLQTFEGFQAEYRASGGSDDIARRMYDELTTWLVRHIRGVDAQLAPCVHTAESASPA
jgi:hemerythrin